MDKHIVFHDTGEDNYIGVFPLPIKSHQKALVRCWDKRPEECRLPWDDKPKPVEIIEVTDFIVVPRKYPEWVERYK